MIKPGKLQNVPDEESDRPPLSLLHIHLHSCAIQSHRSVAIVNVAWHFHKMTNELPPQLDSSGLVEHSSIELAYPRLTVPASYINLPSPPASRNMANDIRSDNQDTALSESWATLSDADYSFDDDLRSETTDAASLVDNSGPDDVRSIDGQTSDAGSHDTQSDKDIYQELPPHTPSLESAQTPGTEIAGSLGGSRLWRPIELDLQDSRTQAGSAEVAQVIRSFSNKEAEEIMGYTFQRDENPQFVGSVGMTISKNSLNIDRPFRLLYVGDASARADILTKIGDILMAGQEPQRNRRRLDSSRYVILPSDASDSSSNHADLIPIRTQIIVDDCTTAASIKSDQAPDQIFLSFKNGSLYSSRWNGTTYEVSSASQWSRPDLAVFFLAGDDHPIVKQRRQLAHAFVSRHEIPAFIIADRTSWVPRLDDLAIDPSAPHLRVEAHKPPKSGESSMLRRLHIDLETFGCLEPHQLNKNLAHLCQHTSAEPTKSLSGLSPAPSHPGPDESRSWRSKVCQFLSMSMSCLPMGTDTPLRGTIVLAVAGLVSLALGLLTCRIAMATFVYLLSSTENVSKLSPATTWSLEPSSTSTILGKAPSVIQTGGAVIRTSHEAVSKSLATIDTASSLAELITNKSVQVTNKSENFHVHSIGDSHIVVQTPRGFKVRNKSTPFDVVVTRGVRFLDSSLSKLFDGVYTIQVDREEAYGLLNVTIRRPKSSLWEEHQVDLGAQWLKMAGWKKAVQIASEQVRIDLDTAQLALSTACDQLFEDVQIKSKDISKKAARQAKKFSQQSRLFLDSTAELLRTRSIQLQHATKHERQEAYKALSKQADLAFKALVVYAHTTNEQGRAIVERILLSAGQTAELIQQNTPHVDLADVQNKMQEYVRSERLAKAQERAKQILKDTSSIWRQRRASRKSRRARCGRKGKFCNR